MAVAIATAAAPQDSRIERCQGRTDEPYGSDISGSCNDRGCNEWHIVTRIEHGRADATCIFSFTDKPGRVPSDKLVAWCKQSVKQDVAALRELKRSGNKCFLDAKVPGDPSSVFVRRSINPIAGGWVLRVQVSTEPSNKPLHRDASGGLTAAVVAGERRR
jgi:hypothetical protein